MNTQITGIALRALTLISPLALVACGGGDGPAVCSNPNPAVCAAVGSAPASSTNNTTIDNMNAGSLFTTAPTAVTLNAGTVVTYGVGGGKPPYTATSGNTNVGKASMSGTTLSLSSVAAGTSPVVVVDSVGKTVNIALTVLAQGQAGTALSVAPGALTIGDCTTNVPFIFSGGVPPYTVFSSDNFRVPVSSPLKLDESLGSYYYTATIQYGTSLLTNTGAVSFTNPLLPATLTILDSQSRTATVKVTTEAIGTPCPLNPLLKVIPESANFRASEIRSFQVTGGPTPAKAPIVTFADPAVAKHVPVSDTEFNVQAVESVTVPRTTLMTVVTADQQRTSVVITVLPQPKP